MKTKTSLLPGFSGVMGLLAALALTANAQTSATSTTTVEATATVSKPALSTGLDDIVKLSKAGIDDSVILVYVRGSSIAYTPTAQDLIQLRGAGVSPTVTAALMQRGDELRKASAETWRQNQAAQTAVAQPAAQPTIVYTAPVVPPVSTVTVIGYPRTYGYSYPVDYYRYNYCAPSYSYEYYPRYGYSSCSSYPRVSFGVNFGGFYAGGRHGGVYVGGGHGGYGRCR